MTFVLSIVGKSNVGKSTIFNRLTRSRDAIVLDEFRLTRDRKYGIGHHGLNRYVLIDTGGILFDTNDEIDKLVVEQSRKAIEESDSILVVLDTKSGVSNEDVEIFRLIRKHNKNNIYVAINKVDCTGSENNIEEIEENIYRNGFNKIFRISAEHDIGINHMIENILSEYKSVDSLDSDSDTYYDGNIGYNKDRIKIAIIGKPNAGKSTLVNRILGESRTIVSDIPGTTRDNISIDLDRDDRKYTLIDTAGIKRRYKMVAKGSEKISMIKALQSIDMVEVVVLLIDITQNISDQDLWMIGVIIDSKKSLIIAINKCDISSAEYKREIETKIDRKLRFVRFAEIKYLSGLNGFGIRGLFESINKSYDSSHTEFSPSELTNILIDSVRRTSPRMVNGLCPKLKYANQVGKNPISIIVHGSRTELISDQYTSYLENSFRNHLHIYGSNIRVIYRNS